MTSASHQTVKLGRGKHRSPDDGACVMELASMLAGEPFSDHPGSACRVTGAFMRAYNDAIEDERRQDLYMYASRVVGSRSSAGVERARAERVVEWTSELHRRRGHGRRLWPLWRMGTWTYGTEPDAIAGRAVREILRTDGDLHSEVLALVDELLTIGAPPHDGAARYGARAVSRREAAAA